MTPPIAKSELSQYTLVTLFSWKCASIGGFVSNIFICSKALLHSSVNSNIFSLLYFLMASVRGNVILAKFGTFLRKKFAAPRNDLSSLILVGFRRLRIA